MNVETLSRTVGAEIVCGKDHAKNELSGCYIGDLLSLAMSRIQAGNIWITIQTNINIAAVASLTEAGCILLCDSCTPDENTAERADREGIPILVSEKSAYALAKELSGAGI